MTTIYVSGVHSGPNPSPGLGVARCLRAAYPEARLIAVDYSPRSTGLHSDVFDDVWLQPSWREIDLDTHAKHIRGTLRSGSYWLSCLDLEVKWLAAASLAGGRVLVPPSRALRGSRKPDFPAIRSLPARVPESVLTDRPDWDLHAFCRKHDWQAWLKGPQHDARRVRDWPGFCRLRSELAQTWHTEDLILQTHISGREESVAFSALRGRLLGCVLMEKREQTEHGKTWAGRIADVPADLHDALTKAVGDLHWTGGGETEFIRDGDGALHVIDWNPRFPAWIYGAAIAGQNLPAVLLEAAGAGRPVPMKAVGREFARVVLEVPVRAGLPLPVRDPRDNWELGGGKHPSGMPDLAQRIASPTHGAVGPPPSVSRQVIAALPTRQLARIRTPARILLPGVLSRRLRILRAATMAAPPEGVALAFAYSIKTNPHRHILREAARVGLLAEVISPGEATLALASGFRPNRIVVNGPLGGRAQSSRGRPHHAWFADSLEALELWLASRRPAASFVGARLRPTGTNSRFGVDLADPGCFADLVGLLARVPAKQKLGLHFHVASDASGTRTWWKLWSSFLACAAAVAECARKPIACLDVGGGWFPDDFDRDFLPGCRPMITEAKSRLPTLEQVIAEPGKALVQPAMALLTTIVEVRRTTGGGREVVADAAVSDLPLTRVYPHRVLARDGRGGWRPLAAGADRILGRACMEQDVLAEGVLLPGTLRSGHRLVFLDAGGYDASMAHSFGTGGLHDA